MAELSLATAVLCLIAIAYRVILDRIALNTINRQGRSSFVRNTGGQVRTPTGWSRHPSLALVALFDAIEIAAGIWVVQRFESAHLRVAGGADYPVAGVLAFSAAMKRSAGAPEGDSRPTDGEDPPAATHVAVPQTEMQDVWQLLELAAIHHPDTLAVVDCGADRLMTYTQLHARASAAAAWLRAAGVRRGDRVGLLSRNSALVMELHFAAAALHAVVVNLNIHLAPRELTFILADSGARLVAADRAYASPLLAALNELADKAEAVQVGSGGIITDAASAAAAQSAVPSINTVVWLDVEPPSMAQLEACAAASVQVGGEQTQAP